MESKKRRVLQLRKEFFAAYKDSTGKKISNDLGNHKTDEYYEPIRNDLRLWLGYENTDVQIVSNDIIRKFLFNNLNFNYYPASLQIFKNYIAAINGQKITPVKTNNSKNLAFKGCFILNQNFVSRIIANRANHHSTDFYLSRQVASCQWYGVISDFDCERGIQQKFINHILNSISSDITLLGVAWGPSGSGKSILLRRVGFELFKMGFNILWIEDLHEFCDSDLNLLKSSEQIHIVFLEDWHSIFDERLRREFLTKIVRINNLKIILGDRGPLEIKEYYNYLIENASFELSSSENEKIVNKVADVNDEWKPHLKKIEKQSLNTTPILAILFLLARDSKEFANKSNFTITKFRELVTSDFDRINDVYPSFCFAFYVWSCIYRDYRVYFSWKAILNLADHFSNGKSISGRLQEFEENSMLSSILKHYISSQKILSFDGTNVTVLQFHHDILCEEGICKFLKKDWPIYDNTLKYEVFKVLYNSDEEINLIDFYNGMFPPETKRSPSDDIKLLMFGSMTRYLIFTAQLLRYHVCGLNHLMYQNEKIRSYYDHGWRDFSIEKWIIECSSLIYVSGYSQKTMFKIFKDLKTKGCEDDLIDELFEIYKGENAHKEAMEMMESIYETPEAQEIFGECIKYFLTVKANNVKNHSVALDVLDLATKPNYLDNPNHIDNK